MTTRFTVRSGSAFDRALRKLVKRHPRLVDSYDDVIDILEHLSMKR